MMSSKNLEKLYREKLKDLEMNPNPAVWNKIENSLITQKKSKRKVIYWCFSGATVAALFLLGLFLYQPHPKELIASKKETTEQSSKKQDSTNTVNNKNTSETNQENNNKTPTNKKTIVKNTVVATSEKKQTFSPKKKEVKQQQTQPTLASIYNSKTQTKKTEFTVVGTNEKHTPVSSIKDKKLITAISKPSITDTVLGTQKKNLEKELLAKNPLEEQHDQKDSFRNFWSIAPMISQYVYGSFSDKSTVDPRLDDAEKTGQRTTAYGFNVAYQVSKKIKIKTGIHRITMLQTTNNNALSGVIKISSFQNSSPKLIESSDSSFDQNANSLTSQIVTLNDELAKSSTQNNELEQRFGYIEIPMEANYGLYQTNQLSFYVVGGFSTLFLTENNLEIESNGFSYSEGEATNLNSINFSLNIGTDIEYHFSEKWFLNVNPTFKLQTQTFSKSSNTPYLFGISSGINFKF
ncbi:outer membrane beta-barrel protein [Wenyingzhuangia sp. 2_MG-2023]|nr:outer membrane beta-barrel protein [Wenyingzhuangia sp. 2_MG-2023]